MKKVLIALALVSVAAAPALADYGKAPTTPRHNATVSKAERHARGCAAHQTYGRLTTPTGRHATTIRIMTPTGAFSRVESGA